VGVASAGPVAIGLGDNWRLAWLVFVVLAVGTGILATVCAPRATRRSQLLLSAVGPQSSDPRNTPLPGDTSTRLIPPRPPDLASAAGVTFTAGGCLEP
jgi:hypothetical protein